MSKKPASKELEQGIKALEDLTRELKQTEGALEGHKETLSAMLNAISDHMSMIDFDMNIIWANETARKIFGDDIIGKKCYEAYHRRKKPCEPYPCSTVKSFQDGKVHQHDTQSITKEGKIIHFQSISNVALRDEAGKPIAVLDISRDITAQKKAEAELRNSEEKYHFLVDNFDGSITLFDSDDLLLLINTTGARNLGGTPEDFIGKSLYDLFPDRADVLNERNRQAIKSGRGRTYEDIFELPTGKRWFWSNIQPVKDAKGNVFAVQIISYDVTDRIKMEEELAAEKEQLAVTLRSIGDAVVTMDTEGNVVLINKVAEELTGWTQERAIGKPFGDVFHIMDENTGERCRDPVEKIMKSGKTSAIGLCTILIDRAGSERMLAHNGAPVYNPESEVIGVVLVLRDVTEARKMEEERLKIQKLESVGQLAGGIAHDFNNILTGILMNIELAKKYAKGSRKVLDKLMSAEMASFRAQALTRQLLTFSRGGAPVKEVGHITGIIKKSAEFALTGSNVQCEFSIQEDLWPVAFDSGQISQVIHNLILNADQAMPEEGMIHVQADNVVIGRGRVVPLDEGKYVKISIEDQGIGISRQHIQKIFDPFFTTKQKGSGLGLATSYSIIMNHGGHIGVESELDAGTTFHVYLPASEEKILAKKKAEEKMVAGEGKILVMDDEEIIRDSVTEILEEAGYRVESAKHGTEAVRLYKKAEAKGEPFDVVILDLTVRGGTGGKEALKKLLKIDPQVKAVVASGYSTDPVMSDFKQYGFSGCIVKPYKISELYSIIQRVMETE